MKENNNEEKTLYVWEDLTDVDYSDKDISDCTFVECDMRGIKLSKDPEDVIGAKFIDCIFSLLYNPLGDGRGMAYIKPFFEAEYRLDNEKKKGYLRPSDFDKDSTVATILPKDIKKRLYINDSTMGYKVVKIPLYDKYGNKYFIPGIALLSIYKDTRKILYSGDKCRAEKVYVVDIEDLLGNKHDIAENYFNFGEYRAQYEVGCETVADSWDDNPMAVCTHGIHFFLRKYEAWKYAYE